MNSVLRKVKVPIKWRHILRKYKNKKDDEDKQKTYNQVFLT
jgi:hypothetical protein